MEQKKGPMIWKTGQWNSPQKSSKKNNFKNKDSLKDLWINMKQNNIYIIGDSEREREEKEKRAANLFEEIMSENFPKLEKEQTSRSRNPTSSKKVEYHDIHTNADHNYDVKS